MWKGCRRFDKIGGGTMKDKFKKQLWISSGIIGGSIIAALIAIYFFSSSLAAATQKIIADRSLVASQTSALASLADLKRDAPLALRYEAAINKLLPSQYTLIGFGQWLEGRAAQYGVTTNFSFQGAPVPATPDTFGTAVFSAEAEGPAANITAFMKDIEMQAPSFLLTLDSFDFTNNGTTSRATMGGTLFFQ